MIFPRNVVTRELFRPPLRLSLGLLSPLFVLFSIILASAQSIPYDTLIRQANLLYKQKSYEASFAKYEAAFAKRKDNYIDLYNGACSAALTGNAGVSMALLKESIDRGYSNAAHLQADPDLFILHPAGEWPTIIRSVEENSKKYSPETVLRQVAQALESNKPEELAQLISPGFKAGTSSSNLSKIVNSIYAALQDSEVTFGDMNAATSSGQSVISGVFSSNKVWKYMCLPFFFDQNANAILGRHVGYHITIELVESRPGWKLNSLLLKDDLVDKKFNVEKTIKDFLSDNAECQMAFGVITERKQIGGVTMMKPEDLKINVEELTFQYQAAGPRASQKHATRMYKLAMFREIPFTPPKKTPDFGSADILEQLKTTETQSLEFIFYGEDIDLVLISTGKEYGFYKINGSETIKEIIKNNLAKMPD